MKNNLLYILVFALILGACAENEIDVALEDENFPFRLQIDEEGADLPDAEDYDIEISFADYLGDLPSAPVTLTYTLSGEGDFTHVEIDEIIYEYEDDDCVWEREITFTESTITIPVDPDMGTVPEEFEVVVAFGLPDDTEAADGGFTFEITGIQSDANVAFNAVAEFEYEILDNEAAGEWVLELEDEAAFEAFKEVFGKLSANLDGLSFTDITGEVVFEFGFEEVTVSVELQETEEVSECENGEVETEIENLVVEIEAEYDVDDEDGVITFEGSRFNEDGEELDFLAAATYAFIGENLELSFTRMVDEDHYEEGDELFRGETTLTLIKD